MFIAVNKVVAPEAQRQMTIEAFEKHGPSMKQLKGFLGLELWTAEDGTISAVSRWESREAMEEYVNSPLFGSHHSGSSHHSGESSNQPGQIGYYNGKIIC